MRPLGEVSARLVRRAVALAETRRGAGVVFLIALGVWWLEALAVPLGPGRDLGTYLGAYVQLLQSHAVDLGYVLGRTPIAPLIVGGLLDLAGGAFAEPVVSLLFAGSILAWFLAARTFSVRAAILTATALILYPGYAILFHELSSDAVFAAAFAGWSLLLVRVLRSPTARGFALVGLGVGILALIRPGNQLLLAFALVPLALGGRRRERVLSAAAFLVPALVLLVGWAIHNGLRYGDYTVARGGNATVPFYRTFVTDKIVRPSNGPASRELARAVQRDLLPKEPYRSYGITLDDFFRDASPRMQVDLIALSDRIKGWHTNARWLRDVGVEAVRTHPVRYARGVAGSTWGLLTHALYRDVPSRGGTTSDTQTSQTAATVVIGGRTLPKPTEGEPIPAAHEGGITTPDRSIYTVWTSPSEHHQVFVHPEDKLRNDALHRRMDELATNLPDRRGNTTLVRRLNQASRWFPPPLLWLVVALVAFVWRRPRGTLPLLAPTAAALVVVLVSALGLPAEPHYSVPVAPAFVLLAGGALFARRREAAVAEAWSWPRARVFVGAAVCAVVALWAAASYFSKIQSSFDANKAPQDLEVFLHAAGKVVAGASPYAFHSDQTYAYPPLLAFLAAPLHWLGAGVATLLWALVSLAAIGAALWLLRVRDWRCYAVALAYPITRSAVDLGTVGPLLLLAVAAAWRWRDDLGRAAGAAGAAIALKLFLWPLVVWLALTKRIRAAAGALGVALLLALATWAAIGFAGLGHYPRLLQRLSNDEATSSYSVIALGVRGHLPESAAKVLAVILAAALLAAAVRVARDARRTPRDRDVATLTLTLAAALAASPIVWVHYFLLLVVPLALTRPRLSLLWFAPFAYYPLGESAWPAGDAGKLALALATTTFLIVATARRRPDRPVVAVTTASPSRVPRSPARLTRAR
ncbi:MAG: glycosyltransferase 87 family protein [Gaiellaceae bacterium]